MDNLFIGAPTKEFRPTYRQTTDRELLSRSQGSIHTTTGMTNNKVMKKKEVTLNDALQCAKENEEIMVRAVLTNAFEVTNMGTGGTNIAMFGETEASTTITMGAEAVMFCDMSVREKEFGIAAFEIVDYLSAGICMGLTTPVCNGNSILAILPAADIQSSLRDSIECAMDLRSKSENADYLLSNHGFQLVISFEFLMGFADADGERDKGLVFREDIKECLDEADGEQYENVLIMEPDDHFYGELNVKVYGEQSVEDNELNGNMIFNGKQTVKDDEMNDIMIFDGKQRVEDDEVNGNVIFDDKQSVEDDEMMYLAMTFYETFPAQKSEHRMATTHLDTMSIGHSDTIFTQYPATMGNSRQIYCEKIIFDRGKRCEIDCINASGFVTFGLILHLVFYCVLSDYFGDFVSFYWFWHLFVHFMKKICDDGIWIEGESEWHQVMQKILINSRSYSSIYIIKVMSYLNIILVIFYDFMKFYDFAMSQIAANAHLVIWFWVLFAEIAAANTTTTKAKRASVLVESFCLSFEHGVDRDVDLRKVDLMNDLKIFVDEINGSMSLDSRVAINPPNNEENCIADLSDFIYSNKTSDILSQKIERSILPSNYDAISNEGEREETEPNIGSSIFMCIGALIVVINYIAQMKYCFRK